MANVIIKSDDRRADEAYTASKFGVDNYASSDKRDAIETIAAKSREAYEQAMKPERKYY